MAVGRVPLERRQVAGVLQRHCQPELPSRLGQPGKERQRPCGLGVRLPDGLPMDSDESEVGAALGRAGAGGTGVEGHGVRRYAVPQ